jgi:pyridoxal phosphate phosphatase PHOSPHO2
MSNDKKKILLIFDFDKTIINDDSFGYYAIKMLTKEEKAELFRTPRKQNWVIGFNLTLKMIKSNGTTINEFNKVLEEIPLSKGMEELFSYIGKNKSKYETVIMSSNYQYVIFHLLKYYKTGVLFYFFTYLFLIFFQKLYVLHQENLTQLKKINLFMF